MNETVIEVRKLRKTFGAFTAVDDVSFDVVRGEIFGYLGANGAGKSTTIKILCGLLPPSAGHASIAGCEVGRNAVAVKRKIGYMSQRFSLYPDLTVGENLEFFGGAHGFGGADLRGRITRVLEEVGMTPQRHEMVHSLPGGWLQRVALANALLHNPEVLFLDEPTAGVDPASRRQFMDIVRRHVAAGVTVFLTTHYMDEAEYCERVGMMVQGRLVALGSPEALKRDYVPGTHNATLDQVFQAVVKKETR